MSYSYRKAIYVISFAAAAIASLAAFYQFKNTKVPPFVPTNEWQEVLPGQAVPKVFSCFGGLYGIGTEDPNGL